MSIKMPFFDLPERPQDTPTIACFPTLGAYFGRGDHLCPNPERDGHGHRFHWPLSLAPRASADTHPSPLPGTRGDFQHKKTYERAFL